MIPNNPIRPLQIMAVCAILLLAACSKKSTPPPRPVANFSFTTPNAGQLPAVVNFTSTSTNATSWQWSFGDGNTATSATPSNTYAAAGTYNVKLVVTGDGGTDSITQQVTITQNKPKASFTFTIVDAGNYPTHVNFTNTTTSAVSYKWYFGNGDTSSLQNPVDSFFASKTFTVKLVATNMAGADSVSVPVTINIAPPVTAFTYTITNPYNLPLNVACANTTTHASTYAWSFGDGGTSTAATPTHTYTQGGIYTITLTATNPGGSSVAMQTIHVSPFQVTYVTQEGTTLNLYDWEGRTVSLLMRTPGLDPATMFAWAKVMDSSYGYYQLVTGQFPTIYAQGYIDNHVTIADVPAACGAGCSWIGYTGIEMQNTYTDRMYSYALSKQYDQQNFYECGRNYWFYANQLAYKTNDPCTTGFAVFMRFRAMNATGVNPAPFNSTPFATLVSAEQGLVDIYVGNSSYTWQNTLGANAGVTNSLGLGATDLFCSFCMRLAQNYGDEAFVEKLWKQAALRPTANTTQDAVDNFILAACAAANKNLTTLFMTTWRWPMSPTAQTAANAYPN